VVFELSTGMLASGLVIGGVGFVLFWRGKREGQPGTLLAGIALSALPMVLHSVGLLWLASAGVVGGLGLLRRFGGSARPVA
jgi:hypothetical protein